MNRNIPLTTRAATAPLSRVVARAALALALLAGPAPASPLVGTADEMVADPLTGLALDGFDPVTFFLGAPRAGRADLDHLWSGAAWRFSSEANREAFLRAPQAYAPRLGGHDAVAVARGLLVQADPAIFALHRERLYLFRTEGDRAAFLADPALAERAEARWETLRRDFVGP